MYVVCLLFSKKNSVFCFKGDRAAWDGVRLKVRIEALSVAPEKNKCLEVKE